MYKPPLFIQVDMDGLWAVRRCYGWREGASFETDPVWKQGADEMLRLFGDYGVRASFFIVGRDMKLDWKRDQARRIAGAGHEIANHSFTHTIGLTRFGIGRISSEIRAAHKLITDAGLPAPIGFRSPGYDVDVRVLRALKKLGYLYDASMLPTRLSPVLRLADAWLARRWPTGKRQFGRFAYGAAPRVPYYPHPFSIRHATMGPDENIMELPVTTLPPLGIPLTASAIFSLGPHKVVQILRRERWRMRPVTLLLHGIDLTDCHKPIIFDNRTSSVGGFDRRAKDKRRVIEMVLKHILHDFEVARADEYVRSHLSVGEQR